jgi:hypothetical protein
MTRLLIVVVLPFCMVAKFSTTLVRDIGRSFRYAWLDAMSEVESAKQHWDDD